MKRVNASSIYKKRDFSKSASGYIQELGAGSYLEPTIVKLSDEDCWKFFQHNDWVNSVVNRVVSDCVKVKPIVVPKDRSKKIEGRITRRVKEVQKLIGNPNDNKESFREIREKVIKDMLVFGRGCVEKVHNRGGKLEEIYSIYSPDVRINADKHGNLPTTNAYVLVPQFNLRSGKQEKIKFDINEIIYMPFQPTSRSAYGVKPLDALANSIASDIMRSEYNMNFFLNNGETSGILSLEGMSRKDLKRFREYWNANFKGYDKAHKLAAVNTKVNWTRMALMNKDMEFGEYGVELRTKIFAAFCMQPVVMGVIDSTTGKLNTSEQIELYKDGALRPILEKEKFYYTNEIIQKGLGIEDLEIEFMGIDLGDIYKQSEMDARDVQAGIITINEARANKGKGPVPWGDTPISIMPGGVQVDPETGRIQGQNQDNAKPSDNENVDDDKSFDDYIKSVKFKIESIIDNLGEDIEFTNYGYRAREYEMVINGKGYKYEINTFPVLVKNTKLFDLLEKCLGQNVSNIDHYNLFDCNVKCEFMKSVKSQIEHCVIKNYIGKRENTITELDEIVNKIKSTSLYKILFGIDNAATKA